MEAGALPALPFRLLLPFPARGLGGRPCGQPHHFLHEGQDIAVFHQAGAIGQIVGKEGLGQGAVENRPDFYPGFGRVGAVPMAAALPEEIDVVLLRIHRPPVDLKGTFALDDVLERVGFRRLPLDAIGMVAVGYAGHDEVEGSRRVPLSPEIVDNLPHL